MADIRISEIQRLEIEKAKLEEKLKRYKESHGAEFFVPLAHQQKAIDYINSRKYSTFILLGANQIGKTTLGANLVASWVMGYQPWDKKPSIFGRPTSGRIICSDWEHHAGQVLVPALKKWLLPGYETKKNNVGVEAFWQFRNGSKIEVITHSQETRIHEGWAGDWVWSDEILPREKYTANKRGLVRANGLFLITLTEVQEGWIMDDLILSGDPSVGYLTDIPMAANPFLSPQAIDDFSRACTEEEKEARVYGKSVRLVGRICKEFIRDVHVIPSFKVPGNWPVVAMIDTHYKKSPAIGFYARSERGIDYVIGEVMEDLDPDGIAWAIIRKKEEEGLRLDLVQIDPLSQGDNKCVANRANIEDTFSIIDRILAKKGIRLEIASKDKASGIRNIRQGLSKRTLYFFDNAHRHIWEIQRWKWDRQGKPEKEDDDMMENLYRYTLTGNEYVQPYKKTINIPDYAYA